MGQVPRPRSGVPKPSAPKKQTVKTDTTLVDTTVVAVKDTTVILPDSMVLIPDGEYEIGSDDILPDRKPIHKVKLNAILMDIHEVTNEQYGRFLDSTGYELPPYWSDTLYNKPKQPVVGVSWFDAVEYCKWAGKRLPTEAEWEAAARGGLVECAFPWDGSARKERANYRWDTLEEPKGLLPVGQYTANAYGLYDMAGNVWEWCSDWYSQTYYSDSTAYDNPQGPAKGQAKVMRGGSWNYEGEYMEVSFRNRAKPDLKVNYIGFRCVMDVPEDSLKGK